jgi:hypothetical protein
MAQKQMFAGLKKTIAGMMALFNFKAESDIPIDAEKKELNLTDEQVAKLKEHFGEDYATTMLETVNGEIKAYLENNLDVKAIQDELDAIVKEKDLKKKQLEGAKQEGGDETTLAEKLRLLNEAHSEEKKKREELEATVQKLMKEPEGDSPAVIINGKEVKTGMKHSGTHLFATGKQYDAFDGRPWNARFRDGSVKATDFSSDSNIPTLQGDLEHFVRENPTAINSLFNDFDDLPAEWSRRTGVLDRVSDGYVIAAEIVQGRQKGWSPKNRFRFSVEEGKVFRKKIDITFGGYELQEIENTWLRIKNSDGSHPWKMSFIGFLLSELVKRQKQDDRKAQIRGIYVPTPDGDNTPGKAENSQNGLLFLWWYYRDVLKKFRPFTTGLPAGVPTESNIVDYIEEMIMGIPEDYRGMEGLEIQLSEKWEKAYRKRAAEGYAHHYSTDLGKKEYSLMHPIDRPNYKFQVLKDMTKTDFIGITFSSNVQILDYNVDEKGKFTITQDRRDTHIFADYRLGIRFIFVGNKLAEGAPDELEAQYLWCNNVPVFGSDVKVPAFDDRTGILKMPYPSIQIDEKWVTDIADIEGNLVPGQIVRITGNPALAGVKNLKDNAKFDLQGDYPLNTAGTITLFVNEDKTLKEIERTTTAPTAVSTDVEFDTPAIDANEGTVFRYTGASDSMENILNGVEGKSIRIYGSNTADVVLTLTTAGNITMSADALLASSADYVQLTRINGYWRDTKRVIA